MITLLMRRTTKSAVSATPLLACVFMLLLCFSSILPSPPSLPAGSGGAVVFAQQFPPTPPSPITTALQTFFDMTGGPNWLHKEGWVHGNKDFPYALDNPCDVNLTLHGITCGSGVIYHIDLSENNLTGTLPSYDQFFKALRGDVKIVLLYKNPHLRGVLPVYPPSVPCPITQWDSSFCDLTGTLPDSWFRSGSLNLLLVSQNRFHGAIPDSIKHSGGLTSLFLNNNGFTGAVPDGLCQCRLLVKLNLYSNYFNALPVHCLGGNLSNSLTFFNVGHNSLAIPFPSEMLCKLKALHQIQVQQNVAMYGELPNCTWPRLKVLVVENTNIGGKFPVQLFGMKDLTSIILSLSRFHGEIPDRFDELPKLTVVALNGNGPGATNTWYGPLPMTLFKHQGIQTLSLQYTQLNGTMKFDPALRDISKVTIASNPLIKGEFPVELLYIWLQPSPLTVNQTRTLYIPNNALSGILPLFSKAQEVKNISRVKDAIALWQNDWVGYIPRSILNWVPNASRPNLLHSCPRLFAPVDEDLTTLTGGFTGFLYSLYRAEPTHVPNIGLPEGGQNVLRIFAADRQTCTFTVDYSMYYCSFCYAPNKSMQGNSDYCANFTENAFHTLTRAIPDTATEGANACSFTCYVPALPTRGVHMVRIVYDGFHSDGLKRKGDLSDEGAQLIVYEAQPPLTGISRTSGRLEGCTKISLYGDKFKWLPKPQFVLGKYADLIRMHTQQPRAIHTDVGTIHGETAIDFYIPFANKKNLNITYYNQTGQDLWGTLYPAGIDEGPGIVRTRSDPTSSVNYTFISSNCPSPLVPCGRGYTDPEQCYTPMCRCQSNGYCAMVPTTTTTSTTTTTTTSTTTTVTTTTMTSATTTTTPAPPENTTTETTSAPSTSPPPPTTTSTSTTEPTWAPPITHGSSSSVLDYINDGVTSERFSKQSFSDVMLSSSSPDDSFYSNGDTIPGTFYCSCEAGFNGTMCQNCEPFHYGPNCVVCQCSEHGRCDDGLYGSGQCVCDAWFYLGSQCSVNIIVVVCIIVACVAALVGLYKARKNKQKIKRWINAVKRWWQEREEKKKQKQQQSDEVDPLLAGGGGGDGYKPVSSAASSHGKAGGAGAKSIGQFTDSRSNIVDEAVVVSSPQPHQRRESPPQDRLPASAASQNNSGSNSRNISEGHTVSRMYDDDDPVENDNAQNQQQQQQQQGRNNINASAAAAASATKKSEAKFIADSFANAAALPRRMSYGSTDSDKD